MKVNTSVVHHQRSIRDPGHGHLVYIDTVDAEVLYGTCSWEFIKIVQPHYSSNDKQDNSSSSYKQ